MSWARAGRALLDHALVMAGAPAIAGAALDTEARLEPEPGRTVELV